MRRLLACAALAVLLATGSATAQVGNILHNPEAMEDLLDALVSIQDGIIENSFERRVDGELEAMRNEIRTDLTWTGQNGYLLVVRAFVNAEGQVRMLSSPGRCGSAMTPADALTLCLANGVIQQDAPRGLTYSSSKSYVVWASKHRPFMGLGQDRIEFGIIPGDLSGQLWRDTATALASQTVVSEVRAARDREAINSAITRLRTRMETSQERAQLAQHQDTMNRQQAEARRIDRDLSAKLARIERANGMMQQLDMLQGVLSLSSTVATIRGMMGPGEDTSGLDNLRSTAAARTWLSAYSTRLDTESQAMVGELQRAQREAREAQDAVLRFLDTYGAPPIIRLH